MYRVLTLRLEYTAELSMGCVNVQVGLDVGWCWVGSKIFRRLVSWVGSWVSAGRLQKNIKKLHVIYFVSD